MSIGRGIEGKELRRFSGAFDPVDMPVGALLEEGDDAEPRIANAPAEFLQLGLEEFVVAALDHFRDARLQGDQASANRVRHQIRLAHAHFAAFPKIATLLDGFEESVHIVNELRGQRHARGIARDGEETFARARVVEPLDRRCAVRIAKRRFRSGAKRPARPCALHRK